MDVTSTPSEQQKREQCLRDIKKLNAALAPFATLKNHFLSCNKWKIVECTFKQARLIQAHEKKIFDCAFAKHHGDRAIAVSNDKTLTYWDVHERRLLGRAQLDSAWAMACDISPSGELAAVTSLGGATSLYRLEGHLAAQGGGDAEIAGRLPQQAMYVSCCAFSGEAALLTGCGDQTVRLWDLEKQVAVAELAEHRTGVSCLAGAEGGSLWASGGCDGVVRLWDLRQRKALGVFTVHDSDVNAARFFPGANQLVTSSDDATCRLFDLRSWRQLSVYSHPSVLSGASSVELTSTGHHILALYDDASLIVWDLVSGEIRQRERLEGRQTGLSLSSDGLAVLTGGWDGQLRVWADDCFAGAQTRVVLAREEEE